MARAGGSTSRCVSTRSIWGSRDTPSPGSLTVRLEVSRPSGGHAFRLRFPLHLEGPCVRCLAPAAIDLEVDAREVDQQNTEDEELLSPYVLDDELDIGRWAHDAAVLALPTPNSLPSGLRRTLPWLRRVAE